MIYLTTLSAPGGGEVWLRVLASDGGPRHDGPDTLTGVVVDATGAARRSRLYRTGSTIIVEVDGAARIFGKV